MNEGPSGGRAGDGEAARAQDEVESYYKALFSMVSHDIRAPLGVILGALGEMPEASKVDPEVAVLLRLIRRSGVRLSQYATNLLELSRLDAGRFHLHAEPSCLRTLIDQALEETRQLESGGPIELVAQLPPPPVTAQVDPERFRLIVLNMLAKAYRQAQRSVRVELHLAGELASLEVSDDGRGLPRDELAGLFDPQHVVRNGRGSGLELVLAARLTEAHGGTLRAENIHGAQAVVGTRFVMEMPLWGPPED